LNEECNLPECLSSVSWSDDIVVYDSFSNDKTVEIAKTAGARVFQRKFDNYARQRNMAFKKVEYKNPWILMLDADERVTPKAKNEILQMVAADNHDIGIYRMRRRDMFMGQWLKRTSGYPTWFARVMRVGHVFVHREINEEYTTDLETGFLSSHINHFPFNKGVFYWFARHNKYSSMESSTLATELLQNLEISKLFSRNPVNRRKAIKQLIYRLPLRPFIVFFYLYFFRFGFLDKKPGLIYCLLRSFYEFMIDLKLLEREYRKCDLEF